MALNALQILPTLTKLHQLSSTHIFFFLALALKDSAETHYEEVNGIRGARISERLTHTYTSVTLLQYHVGNPSYEKILWHQENPENEMTGFRNPLRTMNPAAELTVTHFQGSRVLRHHLILELSA
ncbi:hypothetical protein PVL29_008407 [Vitis rotundifolia]|uniref:Uncharacterized protein n=1 Tax=Vitis rotundifolia TaxID=103349 RepID=A0AA38ZVN7_VITRO|nr:hypothetical protein PVL29_008407 [Vitis rotundifolia]